MSNKTIRWLDVWWSRRKRRYDRGPVYVCVMIAVASFALSASILGPTPGGVVTEVLSKQTSDLMALCILFGSLVCLFGICAGSRWFFPKTSIRRCCQIGIIGSPALAVGLLVYGGAVVVGTGNPIVALGGILGPMIAIGDIVNAFFLVLEIRRIDRNIPLAAAVDSEDPMTPIPPDPISGPLRKIREW